MGKDFIKIPRIAAIGMALFLAIFALDVWEEHATILARAEVLFIHLLPSIVIFSVLLISWKKPRWAAILFTSLSTLYVFNEWGHWTAISLIAAPLFIIGFLFFLAYAKRNEQN